MTSSAKQPNAPAAPAAGSGAKPNYKTISEHLSEAPQELLDLYQLISDFMLALGDDVEAKTTAYYIAFRRIKNFAIVELRNQARKLLVYVKVDPASIQLEEGFTRNVKSIGHFGTGDLEITITNLADFEKAKPLLEASYNAS